MIPVLPWNKLLAASIAAAMLAVCLVTTPALADDKNPTPAKQPAPTQESEQPKLPPSESFTQQEQKKEEPSPSKKSAKKKKGESSLEDGKKTTRDETEQFAQYAVDAYDRYQQVCTSGTDEDKKKTKDDWDRTKGVLEGVIRAEADDTKEVRDLRETALFRLEEVKRLEGDPKAEESKVIKARLDMEKAWKAYEKARDPVIKRITAEIRAKFKYDEGEVCPAPDEKKDKKKKKKDKGETSGGLDFLGNVTIGVGASGHDGHHHKDTRRANEREQHGEDADVRDDEHHENISHGSGCGPGSGDRSFEHGDKDKSDDRHDDEKTSSPPM